VGIVKERERECVSKCELLRNLGCLGMTLPERVCVKESERERVCVKERESE